MRVDYFPVNNIPPPSVMKSFLHSWLFRTVFLAGCFLPAPVFSDQPGTQVAASTATSTSLTIYPGRTLVRNTFAAQPDKEGLVTIQGLAKDWQGDSLELEYVGSDRSFAPKQLSWRRGGLNRDRLYRSLVGRPVELLGGGLNVTVQGTMLSYDDGLALVQGTNGRQYLVDWDDSQGVRIASRDSVFLERDYQSYIKARFDPTQYSSQENATLRLSYITPSLGYSSHYRLLLDSDNSATLELNVLLTNNTDTDFTSTAIQLVSGDTGGMGYVDKQAQLEVRQASAEASNQSSQRVGEVLVIPLPGTLQLTARSSQQLSLYRKDPLALEKIYTLDIYGRSYSGRSPVLEKPRLIYRFKAETDLPSGNIRIIQESPDGRALISGNARMPQATAGAYAHLQMGEALAVRVERQRVNNQQKGNEIHSTWRSTIFNDRDEAIRLKLTDRDRSLLRLEDVQGGTLDDAASITVIVPAGSQKVLSHSAVYGR